MLRKTRSSGKAGNQFTQGEVLTETGDTKSLNNKSQKFCFAWKKDRSQAAPMMFLFFSNIFFLGVLHMDIRF